MAGATLDTGVVIALERRQRRALALWAEWARTMTTLTVAAVVIAEWLRDRRGMPGAGSVASTSSPWMRRSPAPRAKLGFDEEKRFGVPRSR